MNSLTGRCLTRLVRRLITTWRTHASALRWALACLLTANSLLSWGLTANSDEPIHIKADRAELDDIKGFARYTGDVLITQGASTLEAEKVTIYANREGLVRIEAVGKPAHYQQKMEQDKLATHAYGDTITYTHDTRTIRVQKNARLEQGKNSFQGDVIEYNTQSRVVTATGSGDKSEPGGRVELIFHPQTTNGTPKTSRADTKPADTGNDH